MMFGKKNDWKNNFKKELKEEKDKIQEELGFDMDKVDRDTIKGMSELMGLMLRASIDKELKENPDSIPARRGKIAMELVECSTNLDYIAWKISGIDDEEFEKYEENLAFVINTLQETAKELNKEV